MFFTLASIVRITSGLDHHDSICFVRGRFHFPDRLIVLISILQALVRVTLRLVVEITWNEFCFTALNMLQMAKINSIKQLEWHSIECIPPPSPLMSQN